MRKKQHKKRAIRLKNQGRLKSGVTKYVDKKMQREKASREEESA